MGVSVLDILLVILLLPLMPWIALGMIYLCLVGLPLLIWLCLCPTFFVCGLIDRYRKVIK